MSQVIMNSKIAAVAGFVALMAAGPVFAEKKQPKGSTATPPNEIAKLYAGKTSAWNRGGFAYWKPNGEFHGVGKTGDAVGIGKWYVTTKSKLCHETIWHWIKDGQQEHGDYKHCWEFVTAPDGTIWQRDLTDKSEWYRYKASKHTKGNSQKRAFNSLRKQFGV